jgi:hypothetical protein
MLTHYGLFQVQICCHTITRKGAVRRATKVCRHNYSLVRIRTTSTAESLVEILRNKYRKEESKDKQVTSAKLQKIKNKRGKHEETDKKTKKLLLLLLLLLLFKETSIYDIFSTLWLICSNR